MRCLSLVLAMALLAGPLLAADAEKPINFEEHIAGILKQHCLQCTAGRRTASSSLPAAWDLPR